MQTRATVEELAAAEKINPSHVSRILHLTLLRPDIVASILDGTCPTLLTLATLMKPFPVEWELQKETLPIKPLQSPSAKASNTLPYLPPHRPYPDVT